MTGYFARGTGCAATTSVDLGLYCRMPMSCAGRTTPARPSTPARQTSRRRTRAARWEDGRAAVKPISRILFRLRPPSPGLATGRRRASADDDHSSSPGIAAGVEQPTRRRVGRAVLERLPIWSCSVRGLACHSCYQERGALLPHLFTLTLRLAAKRRVERRYIFCATFRQVTLPGRYPAHCPVEFGLSSPGLTSAARLPARGVAAGSGRLAWLRRSPLMIDD